MIPVPVLLYHSISHDPPAWIRPYSVTPETFARQLELIAESGATGLSVGRYASGLSTGEPLPEQAVVITFDDGLADFRNQALPALRRAGLPVTLFVTTGFLDGQAGGEGGVARPPGIWLDLASVLDLHAEGVEIGAHSHSHPHLDTLSVEAARVEIARPKEMLEGLIESPVVSYAYPHGFHSPAVRRLVRECGYTSACAVTNALSSNRDDRFSIARLTIRADTSLDDLGAWLGGRGAPVAPTRERARTRAWRAYRRGRAVIRRRPGTDFA